MENETIKDEEKILYAINKDGKINFVPKAIGESIHCEPYSRLNEKLGGILGNITINDTGVNLPNIVAKRGFINICPVAVYNLSYGFVVVFPLTKTERQLESLKGLMYVLEKRKMYFWEQPNFKNEDLDWSECIEGTERLKKFIEEELKKLRENRKKNEGR